MKYSILILGLIGFIFISCAKKDEVVETTVSITELDVALVTGKVESLSASNYIETTAIDLGSTCTGCAQSAQLMSTFTAGALTLMGIPDALTCLVEALTETQVISGLGDGETYYIEDTQDGANELTRLAVTVTGTEITSYSISGCKSGTQENYISYSLSNGTATFSIKSTSATGRPNKITATGSYSDGGWTTKTVDIVNDDTSEDGHYAFTQHADYVSVALTTDSLQFYGEAALSGNSPADYALGGGSVKSNTITVPVHFDSVGADTATASSYNATVTAASFAATADVSDIAMSGNEVFSCAIPTGSSATAFSGTAASLSAFQTRFAACQALVKDSN